MNGSTSPLLQLGAAPGTASQTVLGLEGNEPEGNDSVDGAEFASSGEAEVAPRAVLDDYDTELTDEELNAARLADLAASELEAMNYGNDFPEREGSMHYVGEGSMNYGYGYDVNLAERVSGVRDYPTVGATVECIPGTPWGTQGSGDAMYAPT